MNDRRLSVLVIAELLVLAATIGAFLRLAGSVGC